MDGVMLGFNYTISPAQNSQKEIKVLMWGKEYSILIDMLLFFFLGRVESICC